MKNYLAFLGFLSAAALATSVSGCSSEKTEKASVSDTQITTENVIAEGETEPPAESALRTEQTADAADHTIDTDYYKTLFSDRDMNPGYEASAEITLGEVIQSNDSSVAINGTTATITKEGIYRLSGSIADGQIIVDAHNAKVQLILDNAEISSNTSSAILARDCDKLFLTLAPGSVNSLSDSGSYVYEDEAAQEPDACVFSKDSLVINGEGTLNITGNFADGIHSKDDVIITGGAVNITSKGDGIKGKDYTAICGGSLDITSGEDGIKSTKTGDTALGFVYFSGGDIKINAQQDGIQAETDVVITDGTFSITSGNGAESPVKNHNDMDLGGRFDESMTPPDSFGEGMTPPDGFGEGMTPPDGFGESMTPPENAESVANTTETDNSETASISKKGIKGGSSVNVSGGDFVVNSSDDALHSNGTVAVSGGNFTLSSGDDGIHGDLLVKISGGNVKIERSYEGIEGAVIEISAGSTDVNAQDDGINASDGTSQTGLGTYSDGVELNISGSADLHVNAQGDGLDSNGSMRISGGSTVVDGPTSGGNGALDGNGEMIVTSGTLIAAGSAQMAEIPNDSSSQNVVSVTFDSAQSAGTNVQLKDESNAVIIDFTSEKKFENIVISSPELENNCKYTFYLDGAKAESFTINSVVTTIGQQGLMSGGFGGGGKGGGHREDFQPATDADGNPVMPEDRIPHGGRPMPDDIHSNS